MDRDLDPGATPDLAKEFGAKDTQGVLVADVQEDGPAARAKLERGNIITAFNETPVTEPSQLRMLVADTAPGATVTLSVLRENRPSEIKVTVGELPKEMAQAESVGGEHALAGITVEPAPPDRSGRKPGGIRVAEVDPNSPAAMAGLRRGDIIREINRIEQQHPLFGPQFAAGMRRFSCLSDQDEGGGWLWNRGTIASNCTEDKLDGEWSEETIERRANRYAADLILPEFIVRPVGQDCDITFAMVDHLMEQFKTSLIATAIRLVELGSFPAILVCCEAGRRRWFFRSPLVSEDYWPYKGPRSGTATYDVLNRPFEKGLARNMNGESWIGHPSARNHLIHEEAIRLTPNLVLSLLTW